MKALAETDVLVVRPGVPLDRPRAHLAVDGSREGLLGIESFAQKARADQADVRLLHPWIRPAQEILDAAVRHRADLIVMGARGLTGLRGLVVGSVTQRVVRDGATSVLVAR